MQTEKWRCPSKSIEWYYLEICYATLRNRVLKSSSARNALLKLVGGFAQVGCALRHMRVGVRTKTWTVFKA